MQQQIELFLHKFQIEKVFLFQTFYFISANVAEMIGAYI